MALLYSAGRERGMVSEAILLLLWVVGELEAAAAVARDSFLLFRRRSSRRPLFAEYSTEPGALLIAATVMEGSGSTA